MQLSSGTSWHQLQLGVLLGEVMQPLLGQKDLWVPLSYSDHQYRRTDAGRKQQSLEPAVYINSEPLLSHVAVLHRKPASTTTQETLLQRISVGW